MTYQGQQRRGWNRIRVASVFELEAIAAVIVISLREAPELNSALGLESALDQGFPRGARYCLPLLTHIRRGASRVPSRVIKPWQHPKGENQVKSVIRHWEAAYVGADDSNPLSGTVLG